MFGAGGSNIAGFYQGRASGSVAFTPARSRSDSWAGTLQPQIVLFHEYAHHLMLANTEIAVPAWYGEGYAEFLSTARFEKDVVWVGAAAQHRAYELLMEKGLSAEQLFSLDRGKLSESQTSSLYARGWLMAHYMSIDAGRLRQLNAYLLAVNAGKPGAEAARGAFGDLRALDKSLAAYLGKSTLPAYKISLTRLPEPKVTMRPLRPGEKAMIGLRMRSDRGVSQETAQPILAQAVPIGDRMPTIRSSKAGSPRWRSTPGATTSPTPPRTGRWGWTRNRRRRWSTRRRSSCVARRRRSRTRPGGVEGGARLAAEGQSPRPQRRLCADALLSSFGMARAIPTDNAKAALRRAHELVPQDPGVGYAFAIQSLLDGRTDDARGRCGRSPIRHIADPTIRRQSCWPSSMPAGPEPRRWPRRGRK